MWEGAFAAISGFLVKWGTDLFTEYFHRESKEAAQRLAKLERAIELSYALDRWLDGVRNSAIEGEMVEEISVGYSEEVMAITRIYAPHFSHSSFPFFFNKFTQASNGS